MFRHGLAITVVIVGGLLVAPQAADASYRLSRSQARAATRRSVSGVQGLVPGCRPRDAPATARNLLRRWHRWICDWTGTHVRSDNALGVCTGSIYVTGRRRGWRSRPHRSVRCTYGPPTTGPQGPSGAPSQQQILDHTYQSAVEIGRGHVGKSGTGFGYTYNYAVTDCVMIAADQGRCTVWQFVDDGNVGLNLPPGVHRVSFYREVALSSWLTTSGSYYDSYNPVDYWNPAQTCYTTDYANYYNCTPLQSTI